MNDYYIAIDENGQPYIAHAGMISNAVSTVRNGVGRGVRQNHKYLMKIGEGTKARYLYTQQEVQAYMRGGRKALDQMAKNTKENARNGLTAASDKIGVKARKDLKEKTAAAKEPNIKTFQGVDRNGIHTGTRPKDTIRRNREISEAVTAKKNYDKTLLGKAENKVKSTSDHMKDAVDYAKENSTLLNVGNQYNAAKRAHEFAKSSNPVTAQFGRKGYSENNTLGGKVYKTQQAVKEKIGNDARKDVSEKKADLERAKRLTKESRERHGSEDGLTKGFSKMVREREKQLNAAERKYDKTLLGKAEGAVDNAKETGKSAISNVKSAPDRMKEEFRKKKDEVKDTVQKLNDKRKEIQDKHTVIEEGGHTAEEWLNSKEGQRYLKKASSDNLDEKMNKNNKSTSDRMKEEFQKKKDGAKDVAEGVKAYREWDKNPSKESFDAVKNNKTASGIREARNNLHDKLDNMAWKAAKGLEGADVRKEFEKASDEFQKNPTPENKQKRDELYDKWVETPHGKFINNEFIAGVQQNGLKDTVKDAIDEGKSKIRNKKK